MHFLKLLLFLTVFSTQIWAQNVRELMWSELIPKDAKAPTLQLAPLHAFGDESGPRAAQSYLDAPINKQLDGQKIKLPGYVVPLDLDDNYRVNEFLFVPYFGACIHVPPPPPNQIIYVKAELGINIADMYEPFWIEGTLKVSTVNSELAQAGYSLTADKIYRYQLD